MPFPPYPPVPSPSTWSSGPVLTSSLRSNVTNGVLFLSQRPAFTGLCTGGPAIPSATNTTLALDTEVYDTWAGHDPLSANPDRYWCQAPGWYLCEGYMPWAYTTATQVNFQVSIGAVTAAGSAVYPGQDHPVDSQRNPGVFGADLIQLSRAGAIGGAAVDYVTLIAKQSSAGSVSVQSASPNQPRLTLRWVATGAATSLAIPANASWVTPPSIVTSTFLNTNIRDTIAFLANPPILRYTYTPGSATLGSQTFPAGSKIAMGTATVDNYTAWDGTNNQYVCPVAGVYYVYGQVGLAGSGSSGAYAAGISVNGGTTTWGQRVNANADTGHVVDVAICRRVRVTAGQTISLQGSQNTGGALALNGDTHLVICWESS